MLNRHWLELFIERKDQEVWIRGQGSRGENPDPHELGPDFTLSRLKSFAKDVAHAVATEQPIEGLAFKTAQDLYEALFAGPVGVPFARLLEASQGAPLLMRLMIKDRELQEVPWEAACRPRTTDGFLGCVPDLLVARGLISEEALARREPYEISGPTRVLSISPEGKNVVTRLEDALRERLASGEVAMLPSITGDAARPDHLFGQLQRRPAAHVLHFLGHGGVDPDGNPTLALTRDAEESDETPWIKAEALAQEMKASFGQKLRLVFLEACKGARPGVFGSAAEVFARAGADAVVAYIHPVRSDAARLASSAFYLALAGKANQEGDVAASLAAGRRQVLLNLKSAEAFSPVLYLRGQSSQIFDFPERVVVPPAPPSSQGTPAVSGLDPDLGTLIRSSFSLVLGELGEEHRAGRMALRDRVERDLTELEEREIDSMPLSALAQRYEMSLERSRLALIFDEEVRTLLRADTGRPPRLVEALSKIIHPGVHTTLWWVPILERCIAANQPDRNLYVVELVAFESDGGPVVVRRAAGEKEWRAPLKLPRLDLEKDIVVLRLCGGLSPHADPLFASPKLTEDDYIQGLFNPDAGLPKEWMAPILAWLRVPERSLLLTGISILSWRHRMVLRWLCGNAPLSRNSVVLIDPGADPVEAAIWRSGKGLVRKGSVRVVQQAAADIAEALDPTPRAP